MLARLRVSFLAILLAVLLTSALASTPTSPFPCTGDGLLFQNPDLLHDLFVFKCVTTVVFNADTGGEAANESQSSTFYGQGYQAYGKETLKKLYSADIPAISSTDGRNRYTVAELKDVVATILGFRRAKDIRVLDYVDSFSVTDTDDVQLEHADRVASAKIVVDAVREKGIPGTVKGYACDALRNLKNNLHTPDYIKKFAAFFEYARHDPDMCQSLQECGDRLRKINAYTDDYDEGNHIYEFLKREYYASPA
ncbi:predicted protein [Pyrenophora tritici-repentis Pt-1C-BFP]|uniref:Uncharacterized protein n=1 Tax=Pyrenophora tritici-repentis (strain Pt-1C-BFP) TaxID=426418 RepID=B2WNY3_PYRTR|nr:uncharacterized protein PTRG_11693 [Pyrenophora tritici-repentis Pt-1C-BFP]EDU44743.1 predicted protein [Pyrenophora tritici-repentis Pt-1C-BFP]